MVAMIRFSRVDKALNTDGNVVQVNLNLAGVGGEFTVRGHQ